MIKHQHLRLSVAVRLFLALILRQVKWWSVTMVTRYDVISSRWSTHFLVYFLFQLFSTIKEKFVDKMRQSSYFCIILHVKHKKLPILPVFTWFLILGRIQDHGPPAAPPPIKYTSSCWESQRLFTEGKSFSKCCNLWCPPSLLPRWGHL